MLWKKESVGRFSELVARGDAARDSKAWEVAAEHYKNALKAEPDNSSIWVQLGNMLKESGKLKEAEEAYLRSNSIKEDFDTYLQLGHLYKVMGRRRSAEENYTFAFKLNPEGDDARSELSRMGWSTARMRDLLVKAGVELKSASANSAIIAFEISDLIDHLARTRYPTGIQRVQLSLGAALAKEFNDEQVQFVYFDHHQSAFFEVQHQHMLDLMDIVGDSQIEDSTRRDAVNRIHATVVQSQPYEFPEGAFLINTGTSWGFLNYFLALREAKRRSRIFYVPLVHDCIPLLYPEFCDPNLVRDFINWITQMIGDADLILTNSDNTLSDVRKVAERLGAKLPMIVTTRLDGSYGAETGDDPEADRASLNLLQVNNLDFEDFVLFVSTIEPRKNHMLALNAWSRMIKARPAGKVPCLVCVGSSGWMNEPFYQRLERDHALRERVVVMQNVSEQTLQLLYSRALFTLFPSLYEGWGLPISEALAHGKVPLVSRVSSHPEAGGDLAVYFDVASEGDFQSKLEALIDNDDMRRALEEKIKSARPLRPWSDIAKETFAAVEARRGELAKSAEVGKQALAPAIASGRYYSFARNLAPDLQRITFSGEVYRSGLGWHAPEPFGCWIGRTADIAFTVPPEEGDEFIVYLKWRSTGHSDNEVTFSVPPSSWATRVILPSTAVRWDTIPLRFSAGSKREVRIRIGADHVDDFAVASGGIDRRKVALGLDGIYICRVADNAQRMAIIEAIQLGNLEPLSRKFREQAVI